MLPDLNSTARGHSELQGGSEGKEIGRYDVVRVSTQTYHDLLDISTADTKSGLKRSQSEQSIPFSTSF